LALRRYVAVLAASVVMPECCPIILGTRLGGNQNFSLQAISGRGATGVEPATSGVTDQFEGREVNDVGCVVPLFMRVWRLQRSAPESLSRARRDVCCPFAVRAR
jgi:hypothetical protein